MNRSDPLRLAILYPGHQEIRAAATAENNRFADLFRAFAALDVQVEPAVYHDDFASEVRQQLLSCDGVLVWVNPIEGGRDRSVLDGILREVAQAGVFVSTHPDVILRLGTKEVLPRTREVGWGCDTHLYLTPDQMRRELPGRLATGKARVLKQNRGNGGDGVWRVQLPPEPSAGGGDAGATVPDLHTIVCVRHAKRGAVEEKMTIGEFCGRCDDYFRGVDGRMVDQEYQERLPEGMIRCYLVHDRVAGFGHQAVNALFPAPHGTAPEEAPQPGPRHYHAPSMAEFQALRRKLEDEWVTAARQLLKLERESLPVLWDCDFLLGPRDAKGEDTYVLCEINVSSVAPYPESAIPYIVEATLARMRAARRNRGTAPPPQAARSADSRRTGDSTRMMDRMFMRAGLTDRVTSDRHETRHFRPGDEPALGELMYRAYFGTVDYDGETPEEAAAEIRKTLAGAYGIFRPEDSFVVERDGRILSATLITHAHGTPFVAFSFTDPEFTNQGLARACMEASMAGLSARGERELRLLVTRANGAAVRLYTGLGFHCES